VNFFVLSLHHNHVILCVEYMQLNITRIRIVFYEENRNVAAEWLALLLPILEVTGSNLGPDTAYTDWGFRGFPQSLHEETRDSRLTLR
jgi:hypothetical protein